MTSQLVSILGLPRKDRTGGRRYDTAAYRFPDGAAFTTTTFGLALESWFRTRDRAPLPFDRLLWLGTSRSAWASLLQSVLEDRALEEEIFLELFEAEEASQAQLDRLAAALQRATGRPHACRIVPACADPGQQADFVTLLAGQLATGDRVVLDLTHGLRNQSLLLAQSALMLEGAFGVRIEGLFYGGLEVPRGEGELAPAVDLTGLLVQARLAQALAAFRTSGDVRVLVEHLPQGEFRRQIANLGHAVAIHDYTVARNLATHALGLVEEAHVGVLEPALRGALATFKAGTLAESQFKQAEAHLARKDFLRATLELFEAAVTRVCQRKGWEGGRAEDRIHGAVKALRALSSDDWKALEFLRNQMAHGIATDWHGLMLEAKNPDMLEKRLRDLLHVIPNLAERA